MLILYSLCLPAQESTSPSHKLVECQCDFEVWLSCIIIELTEFSPPINFSLNNILLLLASKDIDLQPFFISVLGHLPMSKFISVVKWKPTLFLGQLCIYSGTPGTSGWTPLSTSYSFSPRFALHST